MNDLDTLTALAQRLHATERRDGRYHADCPFCGKEEKRGQTHFSFCDKGYSCWVCGNQGGINALARHLDMQITPVAPRTKAAVAPRAYRWQSDTDRTLAAFLEASTRLQQWQAYKPVSIDTVATYRLGYGVLPSSRCRHRRLIVPVFDQGRLVALHGRACHADDTDAKWLTAGGSRKDILYNADRLRDGATVIIAENLVDCLLAMQHRPDVVAVASGGVAWREAFTAQIAASKPSRVIVWLDNDLAGCPNAETYRALREEWEAQMREKVTQGIIPRLPTLPAPIGPVIAKALQASGVNAACYRWDVGTPPKADLGWALLQ